jgi:hypothetical protein
VAGTARALGVVVVNGEEVRAWVERTCAAQGLPVKVGDPVAVAGIAVLLGQSRQTGSTRSGSKAVRPRTAGQMTARSRTAATTAR